MRVLKVLKNVGIGTELSKRQHLDGVVLTKECKCGEIIEVDLEKDYLSYPTIGYESDVYLYCDECGEEYHPMKVILNMDLTILGEGE